MAFIISLEYRLTSYNSNASFSVWQMPFYIILTTFRVLSISIAIVALQWICLPIYLVLIVTIVIIGYKKTSKEEDFLTRGLVSAFTTGEYHSPNREID